MVNQRLVYDSMGEISVPENALYGAQTARALENFKISTLVLPSDFIASIALIKHSCAKANQSLGLLPAEVSEAIRHVALDIYAGKYMDQFPLDVFQTGSGTSTNMNVNEVIACLASKELGQAVHPNDHVNMGQSSNDVIPAAIHLSASLGVVQSLLPAIKSLQAVILDKAQDIGDVVTTGRTHLMDAVPISYEQILGGWVGQLGANLGRIKSSLGELCKLPLGGTAVGTGLNSHPDMARQACLYIAELTDLSVTKMDDPIVAISSQDVAVQCSGQLKTLAVTLMKISNDLRWLNSGPLAGIGEITLPALQPGSSIMPGKINPVIPEAVAMAAAQVMGNDTTITVAGQSGNFQLNVMLPVISYNLLQSIHILAESCNHLGHKAIRGMSVNEGRIQKKLKKNPILATGLNPVIGYERGAAIIKAARKQQRSIIDVACEMTDLSREELENILSPVRLTHPHQIDK